MGLISRGNNTHVEIQTGNSSEIQTGNSSEIHVFYVPRQQSNLRLHNVRALLRIVKMASRVVKNDLQLMNKIFSVGGRAVCDYVKLGKIRTENGSYEPYVHACF